MKRKTQISKPEPRRKQTTYLLFTYSYKCLVEEILTLYMQECMIVTHRRASYTTCSGSFPAEKGRRRGVDHPSSAEVKETVELYPYPTSGPSWPVLGSTFPLPSPSFVRLKSCAQAICNYM